MNPWKGLGNREPRVPPPPMKAREDFICGDYGCIEDTCDKFPDVLTMCEDCGTRFACNKHRDLLYWLEKEQHHLRKVYTASNLFAHNGWPFITPTAAERKKRERKK